VAGFWNDINEPAVWGTYMPDIVQFDDNGYQADHRRIHNVYELANAQATHEALEKYSTSRHLVLTRAGFAGTQRHAAMWNSAFSRPAEPPMNSMKTMEKAVDTGREPIPSLRWRQRKAPMVPVWFILHRSTTAMRGQEKLIYSDFFAPCTFQSSDP
jgi:hypothetical protein